MRSAAPHILAAGLALILTGCGHYASFTLPAEETAQAGHYEWQPRSGVVLRAEAVDTLNPSVVKWRDSLLNLYSVYDGKTWHTESAISEDGLAWSGARRVISPRNGSWESGYIAANGAGIVFQGELLYFYQAGNPPQIGLAHSEDAKVWTREAAPVLALGPRGAWDERATADPYVVQAGGQMYLYYLGEDRARRQRLGVAVSNDGRQWTKLTGAPVLELGEQGAWDENGLGEPAVWSAHGAWWMLYTGRARNEPRRMGLVKSADGVHWTRTGVVISGAEAWNSQVVCDATVLPEEDRVRVWFGGGDVAHPAENIHGRIGYGELIWRK